MRKTLKFLVLAILALIVVFPLVGCTKDSVEKDGIQYKKAKGDSGYTLTSYVDDGITTILDLGVVQQQKGIEIERIKKDAFNGNETLTKIIVPSSVKTIDEGAFAGMCALTEIELPFVGANRNADAFYRETADSEDKAVDAMRTIGYIFGKTEYDYGKKVSISYNSASSEDYYLPINLNSIVINNIGGEDYSIPMYAFNGLKDVKSISLKGNIKAIGEYAFANSDIEFINIPSEVTKIYAGAFSECGSLKSLGLKFDDNSKVTYFGDYAFYATKIVNFVMPETVEEIGEYCFASKVSNTLEITNASKLKSIKLSKNLAKIGDYAFAYCEDLITVDDTDVLNQAIKTYVANEQYKISK